jgi:hypothetical protein
VFAVATAHQAAVNISDCFLGGIDGALAPSHALRCSPLRHESKRGRHARQMMQLSALHTESSMPNRSGMWFLIIGQQ